MMDFKSDRLLVKFGYLPPCRRTLKSPMWVNSRLFARKERPSASTHSPLRRVHSFGAWRCWQKSFAWDFGIGEQEQEMRLLETPVKRGLEILLLRFSLHQMSWSHHTNQRRGGGISPYFDRVALLCFSIADFSLEFHGFLLSGFLSIS